MKERLKILYYMIRGEWAVGYEKKSRWAIDRTYYDGEILQFHAWRFWLFIRY